MSAKNYIKNKWIEIAINAVISALLIFLGFWLTATNTDARELRKKIDEKASKEELKNLREEQKDYVDGCFNNHEMKEQLEFNNLKIEIRSVKDLSDQILKGQNELMEMSIKRIDRLEDKVYQ